MKKVGGMRLEVGGKEFWPCLFCLKPKTKCSSNLKLLKWLEANKQAHGTRLKVDDEELLLDIGLRGRSGGKRSSRLKAARID
jgi:hypothetical protein